LVFDVYEDMAVRIGDRKLRLAGQGNRVDYALGGRIDHARVMAFAVERPDMVRAGLVDDRIGLFARALDRCDRLERVQIEHSDRCGETIADKTLLQILRDRDAMYARGVVDRADLTHLL